MGRGWGGGSHVGSDLFDLVVDDVVDAALRLELGHRGVGGRQVEPLRAGLQVGLGGGGGHRRGELWVKTGE